LSQGTGQLEEMNHLFSGVTHHCLSWRDGWLSTVA
jgi:hypothetical protein